MLCALILALPTLLRALLARVRVRVRLPAGLSGALRPGGARAGAALRLTDTLFLPDRASLHVVEAGGRRLLVGRNASTLAVLCDLGSAADLGSACPPRG